MNLQIVNPIDYPTWDEMVLAKPGYSFFHSAAWARVLHESYGYMPHYFTVFKTGEISTLLPIMEVKSLFSGKRGVSLPFSDYCESIAPDDKEFGELFEYLVRFGRQSGWRYLEMRGSNDFFSRRTHCSYHYGHVVDLRGGADRIYSRLRGNNRRNIGKALREGVKVIISQSAESLEEYYRLHCLTRRKHGLPPQPERFFKNIQNHVISRGLGVVALGRIGERAVAGAVYLGLGKKAVFKYGASDSAYQRLRVNNLVMWEAIKWFSERGFESFCLGRTEPGNEGLDRFKSGWGTRKRIIRYYRYDTSRNIFIAELPNRARGVHNAFLTRMPVAVLKPVGKLLYKHMG